MEMGVEIITAHNLSSCDGKQATLSCEYTGREKIIDAEAVVLITARTPNDGLYQDLMEKMAGDIEDAPQTLKRIGDCEAPAIIAAAIYSGHKNAREIDVEIDEDNPLKHDKVFAEYE